MKKAISTVNAPAAIGPYAQGIDAGSFIFTSGQLPVDPKTGMMPGDIREQARQSLTNVKVVLEAAGSSMDKVENHRVLKGYEQLCRHERGVRHLLCRGHGPRPLRR